MIAVIRVPRPAPEKSTPKTRLNQIENPRKPLLDLTAPDLMFRKYLIEITNSQIPTAVKISPIITRAMIPSVLIINPLPCLATNIIIGDKELKTSQKSPLVLI